jgi:hypothetical protein
MRAAKRTVTCTTKLDIAVSYRTKPNSSRQHILLIISPIAREIKIDAPFIWPSIGGTNRDNELIDSGLQQVPPRIRSHNKIQTHYGFIGIRLERFMIFIGKAASLCGINDVSHIAMLICITKYFWIVRDTDMCPTKVHRKEALKTLPAAIGEFEQNLFEKDFDIFSWCIAIIFHANSKIVTICLAILPIVFCPMAIGRTVLQLDS